MQFWSQKKRRLKGGVMNRFTILALVCLGLLALLAVSTSEAAFDAEKLSYDIGPMLPQGDGVKDYYGSIWLGLKANYKLMESDASEHGLALTLSGGVAEEVILSALDVKRTSSARMIGLRYTYTRKNIGPLFVGAGIGGYMVNTEAKYDAGEDHYWTDNKDRYFTSSKTKAAFAPHFMAGYKHNDRLSVVLEYTMFRGTTLPGNDGDGFFYRPDVPDTRLNSAITLSGRLKF